MLNVSQRVVLIGLVVVGVFGATPLLLSAGLAYAWIALPLVAAYVGWLWFGGWRWFAAGEERDDDIGAGARVGYVLIGLFWSFVGLAVTVFLAIFAWSNWVAVLAAFLLLAVVFGVIIAGDVMKRRREVRPAGKRPGKARRAARSHTDDIVT